VQENASIIDIIKQQIKKEDALPVLNPHAAKIQQAATAQQPDFTVLSRLIRMDPTLTSQVLKTANSPFYRGLDEVETIRDAVIRLGQDEMINIIMKVLLAQKFHSKNPLIQSYQKNLWTHSVNAAIGSQWLVRYLSMTDMVPRAFIAGLLHDMGKLYLLTALEKIMADKTLDFSPPPQLMDKILHNLHPSLGFNLLTRWYLPEPYRIVARDHHSPAFDTGNLMLAIVRLVNKVCNKMEQNKPPEDISRLASTKEADILGASEICIAELEIALEDAGTKTPMA